jgi:DNA invertase Pin-like site-specific DNA recombinase
MTQQCAVYARYSSDIQRSTSIDDQLRKCLDYASKAGWNVNPLHVYIDEGISGMGSDRPGYRALLEAARAKPREFGIVLVDDTSRLSRSLAEVMHLQEFFAFECIRLIAVSQGIDSEHEQAELLFTIHGLVDSLYVRELAKKTHRGLEGLALKALHTGGRCLGYRSIECKGGHRLVVDDHEAELVRYIFALYARGLSFKRIATRLTGEGIPTPRTGRKLTARTWPHTGVREILRRELYLGFLICNKRHFLKRPGTNQRISRLRPESEWIRVSVPELQIVSTELWNTVQARLRDHTQKYDRRHPGFERLSRHHIGTESK